MSKARILIIDDNEGERFLIKEALESEGYEVIEACDGEEGVKLYLENPTELIITDIMMPGKSGIAVIEKLRLENPEIKIIAITAGSSDKGTDFLRMAKILGASRTLRKPIEQNKLFEMVGELIEK